MTQSLVQRHRSARCRRTATSIMAGAFDDRPQRDALTSLLNGVRPNKAVENEKNLRRLRRRERKEENRERRKARALEEMQQKEQNHGSSTPIATINSISLSEASGSVMSPYWASRPAINIASMQRSMSITPPRDLSPYLAPSSPGSTPGPSNSSTISRMSSKRPRTPDDGESLDVKPFNTAPLPRKKKEVVKKGWKGWVEGSPPPSEKLINLDTVPILQDRRTRSGKNFDAISVGKESWI